MYKNRGVLLTIFTESSLCIDVPEMRLLHLLSLIEKCPLSRGWNSRGVPLYTEVSSFQGVGIEEFHCVQR